VTELHQRSATFVFAFHGIILCIDLGDFDALFFRSTEHDSRFIPLESWLEFRIVLVFKHDVVDARDDVFPMSDVGEDLPDARCWRIDVDLDEWLFVGVCHDVAKMRE